VNNWKVIPTIVFATVLIFGAGVFTGGILVDFVKQARPRPAAKRPVPPPNPSVSTVSTVPTNAPNVQGARPLRPAEVLGKDFLQRLDAEILLTKEEHDAIQKIISDGQNQVSKVLLDSRLEIREVLTPNQRDQFDSQMKRQFHRSLFATNAPPIFTNPPPTLTNAP